MASELRRLGSDRLSPVNPEVAMTEVTIRSMDQDEDFAAWLTELLEPEA